jgi:hypothetical protein
LLRVDLHADAPARPACGCPRAARRVFRKRLSNVFSAASIAAADDSGVLAAENEFKDERQEECLAQSAERSRGLEVVTTGNNFLVTFIKNDPKPQRAIQPARRFSLFGISAANRVAAGFFDVMGNRSSKSGRFVRGARMATAHGLRSRRARPRGATNRGGDDDAGSDGVEAQGFSSSAA